MSNQPEVILITGIFVILGLLPHAELRAKQYQLHSPRENVQVIKSAIREVKETIHPVVPHKNSTNIDHYPEMILHFKGNYSICFRAYKDGVAYRLETSFKKKITVVSEAADYQFPGDYTIWFPEEENSFSYIEREYLLWTDPMPTDLPRITKKRPCPYLPMIVCKS